MPRRESGYSEGNALSTALHEPRSRARGSSTGRRRAAVRVDVGQYQMRTGNKGFGRIHRLDGDRPSGGLCGNGWGERENVYRKQHGTA